MKSKAAKTAQTNWKSKITYWAEEGFVRGEPVEVVSARTKGRKGIRPFKYHSHVRNNLTGSEWVDVYDAQGTPWSFTPDSVSLPKPKRKYKKKI